MEEKQEKDSKETVEATQSTKKVVKADQATQTETTTSDDVEKNKGMAILAYILFFIPMLTEAKDSKFAMFHANQSLIILIAGFVLTVINIIPFLGQIVWIIGEIALFVFWIMGIINASKGEMKELPLFGGVHILDKK